MKKLHILTTILKRTHADKIVYSFLLTIFIAAAILTVVEPSFGTYVDSLWYCYAVITTIGFGDLIAVTLIGRIISVFISVHAIIVIAIVTGVVVNYYTQLLQIQQQETLTAFLDRLEHLPELSHEELVEISKNVTNFRPKS